MGQFATRADQGQGEANPTTYIDPIPDGIAYRIFIATVFARLHGCHDTRSRGQSA